MSSEYGLLVLFGSGETGTVGRAIRRKVFQFLGKRDQRAAGKRRKDEGLFEEADKIRENLLKLGYEVRDRESGHKIHIAKARPLGSSR